jgi:hypothetical protein
MRKSPEQILRIICLALGALLFLRFVWVILTANPLARVVVPELPTLPNESSVSNSPPTTTAMMNSAKHGRPDQPVGKKDLPATMTNSAGPRAVAKKADPNAHAVPARAMTNANAPGDLSGTNDRPGHAHRGRHGQLPGAIGFSGPKATVAPAVQASIDRITDSEILGPVVRPLPMALLGIAGQMAFLRTPNGVTGLVKEGDEVGGIKLLRIGINRVLIEENGQQKELSIFGGIGGESLIKTSVQSSNENDHP